MKLYMGIHFSSLSMLIICGTVVFQRRTPYVCASGIALKATQL